MKTCVQVIVCNYFGYVLMSGIVRWCDNSVWLFEEPPDCFPQWLNHFTFPLGIYENSSFNLCYFLFLKHILKNVFYACIYLFLLWWVWSGISLWFSLHPLLTNDVFGHLYTFFSKMSFLSWIFIVVAILRVLLCILDTGSLRNIWFTNTLSHYVN